MQLKRRIVWVVGAEGIGKTTLGAAAAARLGATYIELDRFRTAAWTSLHAVGALRATPYGPCRSYEAARTLSLRSVDEYLDWLVRRTHVDRSFFESWLLDPTTPPRS